MVVKVGGGASCLQMNRIGEVCDGLRRSMWKKQNVFFFFLILFATLRLIAFPFIP